MAGVWDQELGEHVLFGLDSNENWPLEIWTYPAVTAAGFWAEGTATPPALTLCRTVDSHISVPAVGGLFHSLFSFGLEFRGGEAGRSQDFSWFIT